MRAFIDHFRERSLDVMSSGAPVEPLLREFAVALQLEMPGTVIGITVLDKPGKTFRHAIFPSMPPAFTSRLTHHPVTGNRGSCGRAILTGLIVESALVAQDERFSAEWKALFQQYGLTSIVSVPAISNDGRAQGCIAVIHPQGSPPDRDQRTFLQLASTLCAKICIYSRTQESAQILLGEMEHRMSNLFATVGGVAILTMRGYPQPAQFRKVLDERLLMMKRAHSLATQARETELASLLREVLSPYCEQFDILFSGPNIVLAREAASAFALVVHELGTNAAKYGALSQPGGTLHLRWCTEQREGETTFQLSWTESHGPSVAPPSRKGYGTTLIKGSLRNAFDGSATLNYPPTGFTCQISAPFSSRLGRLRETEATTPAC